MSPAVAYRPRQIPITGEPVELVTGYGRWLETTMDLRKLLINAEPGAILVGRQRDYCRSWPTRTEVTVTGTHFVQEDASVEIGRAVADWLRRLP